MPKTKPTPYPHYRDGQYFCEGCDVPMGEVGAIASPLCPVCVSAAYDDRIGFRARRAARCGCEWCQKP